MPKKEFTTTEVMALQEEMLHHIKIIGEQHGTIVDNIQKMNGRLEHIEDDIQIIKVSLRQKVDLNDFQILEKRVIRLEKKLV